MHRENLTMKQRLHVGEYFVETLQDGENASESEYKQADPDVSYGLPFRCEPPTVSILGR